MKKSLFRLFNKTKTLLISFGWMSLIVIPILILINWSYLSVELSEKEALKSQQIALANEKVNTIDFIISNTVTNVYNDMKVLDDSEEMNTYLENTSEDNLGDLEQLFYRIINNKPEFSSLEFLDENGNQKISIVQEGDDLIITDSSELESRSGEDYYPIISTLENNEFYIMPLYLQEVQTPSGNIEQPINSFAIAIYDDSDIHRGYVIVNYNANHILTIFNQYVSDDSNYIDLVVINENEQWRITNNITNLDNESKILEALTAEDDSVVYASVNVQDNIKPLMLNEDDFFTIYGIIDLESVYSEMGSVIIRGPRLLIVINIVSALFIYIFSTIAKSRNDNRILLNANMYLSDKNNDGVLITNSRSEITYVNKAFELTFGYNSDELRNKSSTNFFDFLNFNPKTTRLKVNEVYSKNIWNRNEKGIWILKHLRLKPEVTSGGKIKHFLGIFSEPQLDINALSLTSDYDSIEIFKLFAKAFEDENLVMSKSCAVVIRMINEKSIKIFKSKSKENLGITAFCEFLQVNLGKDFKFSVPLSNYTTIYFSLDKSSDNYDEVIETIENLISKYRHQPNINSELDYNMGVALADNKTITKADLIENAFIAMQMSKGQKNSKNLVYSENIKNIIKRKKEISDQLEYGFKFNEFFLQYQIQKNILTGNYTGAEALLRWNNAFLGNVSPGEFINVIENSVYLNKLSRMVLNKVIKDMTPFIENISPEFRISINLTYYDFFNEQIVSNLVDLIEKSPLSTSNFCFEITESGYLESKDKTNDIIDFLHSKNITVAIDDFGTGFSSLEVLKNIKVDKVKIDRMFIKNYPEKDDGEFLKTIVDLVKSMKLKVLLEGAETKEQMEYASKIGVEEIQGFYISKPLFIENLVKQFINKKSDF